MKYKNTALLLCLLFLLCACRPIGGADGNEEDLSSYGVVARELTRDPNADHRFTLNYMPDRSFNPITGRSSTNLLFAPLIYEPMFELDERFAPQPLLCTDYKTDDGLHYTFTIDTSKQFSDGSYLTASDVQYSFNLAMSSPNCQYYNRLYNAILGVSAYGEETLYITAKRTNYMLPALLDLPIVKRGSDTTAPLGTGPFVLDLEAQCLGLNLYHPDRDAMPVDVIYLENYNTAEEIITAFEDSVIDLVMNDPADSSNLGYGSSLTRYYATTYMHYIGFNLEKAFMYYPAHRVAIGYAINRTYITTNLMGGCATAATLPISPVSDLYNNTLARSYEFSLDKCRAILDSGGTRDMDGDGYREYLSGDAVVHYTLNFVVNGESEVKVAAARDIARNLESIGLRVNLRELGWDDFLDALEEGDFDMYYGEVKLTADWNLRELFLKKGEFSFGAGSDTGESYVDEYLSSSEETRRMYCDFMCKYIADNAPFVPIAFKKEEVLTQRGVVTGMSPTRANVFYKFTGWTIDLGLDN